MTHPTKHESSAKTWLWIAVMLAVILGKGLFSFSIVGDRGQPDWAYRPVPDVPGQSAYAVYPLQPFPQHVRGAMGE